MKKFFTISLLAAALAPAISAQAADGTLTFTGAVVATTCAPTAGANQAVTLTNVQTSSLSAAGNRANGGQFNVQLRACTAAANVRLEFPNATGVDLNSGHMTNTSAGTAANGNNPAIPAATNVRLALRTAADATTDLMLGSAGAVTPTVVAAADGTATIPLWVQYVATGAATAGPVTASVQFDIGYP